MKKEIITIAGTPGSGKSTVAKLLANSLGYNHYSMGDFQRGIAERKKITIEELGELQKRDPVLDREVDQYQESLGRSEEGFVIDSRLGWFFIKSSFKVFLWVRHEIAVERIWNSFEKDSTRNVEKFETPEELSEGIKRRVLCEQERYKDFYGIENHYDEKHFYLVIDTEHQMPSQVADIIQRAYEEWISKP